MWITNLFLVSFIFCSCSTSAQEESCMVYSEAIHYIHKNWDKTIKFYRTPNEVIDPEKPQLKPVESVFAHKLEIYVDTETTVSLYISDKLNDWIEGYCSNCNFHEIKCTQPGNLIKEDIEVYPIKEFNTFTKIYNKNDSSSKPEDTLKYPLVLRFSTVMVSEDHTYSLLGYCSRGASSTLGTTNCYVLIFKKEDGQFKFLDQYKLPMR